MIRKILIATVASLSLLSPLALPTQSEAREPIAHRNCYRVYYRSCDREPWHFAGEYRNRHEASRAVHRYQVRGLESYCR